MGFSSRPFPGATHSRYSHSLGVMHLAGLAFDAAYRSWQFDRPGKREALREVVRIAALCHDLGHAPFSHCVEFAMPPLASLGMSWVPPEHGEDGRRATHEDYSIAILELSSLRQVIEANFAFTARHVAALIATEVRVDDDFFRDGGLDHRRLLSQIVSSELDVDRLDYLVRDAYFTGARYGQVDVGWLIGNLDAYPKDGQVCLALDSRAIYAFDDFLISRHHMFLMVYFHHHSVVYEELLKRYVLSDDCDWALPADLDLYLNADDISLTQHLRGSNNPFARRVVERHPFRRVIERHGTQHEADVSGADAILRRGGIDTITATSVGRLSRYQSGVSKRSRAPEIYVLTRLPGMPVERVSRLGEASQVFERYADARTIGRLYVAPEQVRAARALLGLPVE